MQAFCVQLNLMTQSSFFCRCHELRDHHLLSRLHDENCLGKPFYRAQAENTYAAPGKFDYTVADSYVYVPNNHEHAVRIALC
jgi:hypothetical protein